MKESVRPIGMILVLTLLVAASGLIGPQPKTAHAGPIQAVDVVNTPKVNVANTPGVNIANTPTVNAQQSGPWNVGINGTPTVNVASLPPISITPPALTPVQDVDQPARAPFQVVVALDINGVISTPVTIPTGKRLVVDYVSLEGSTSALTQPVVILYSSVAGGPSTAYYLGPQASAIATGQFYQSEPVTIYADSFAVGLGYANATPAQLTFNVTISGHLISVP